MKRVHSILIVVSVVAMIGIGGVVHAADVQTQDTVTIPREETLRDDLYASGDTVRIEGTVTGDAYVAAQQVTVNGTVEGTLFAAAQSVHVNGSTGGVRAAGQSMDFSDATIDGGVTYFGNIFSSNQQTEVNDGVLFFGRTGTFAGTITNGITAFAQSVTIRGATGTDSIITSEDLRIAETATISGDITHRSDNQADVASGAQIDGEIVREAAPGGGQLPVQAAWAGFTFSLWSFLAAIVTGAVLLLIARRPFSDTADTVRTRPWASLGWGLLGLLVLGPLFLLLLVTVLGVPLAILLLGAALAALYLSKFVVGIAVGRVVLSRVNKTRSPRLFESFLIGLLILYILQLVPLVSFLVGVIVAGMGVGAILLHAFPAVRAQHR